MIRMELGENSYNIELERGILNFAEKYLNLERKVMIVTDEGVPSVYAEKIAEKCREPFIKILKQGEANKTLQAVEEVLTVMLENQFSRKDCVVAVGGGLIGDLSGVAASLYMRGVDFYNVPTTLLAQVDSSIGGKTAVNLGGIKNIVGAFYQPKAVLIDPETLGTLPDRLMINGLMEALKMGVTNDSELVTLIQREDWEKHIDQIIEKALRIKKYVVEQDVKESHLRKILNYGHTIGHGFESAVHGEYLHGECVAIGMLYMASSEVKEKLIKIYENLGFVLPNLTEVDMDEVKRAILHDKKASNKNCSVVYVDEIGNGSIQEWTMEQVLARLEQ